MPPRSLLRVLQLALLPALAVYVLALLLSAAAGIRTQLVIRDLAQTCDTALGVGLLSNLGYLGWIAAAAIALFTALSGVVQVRGRVRQLLLSGGLFSLLLCLDDMFLLHDRYIGSTFLYSLYAIFALLILFRFRSQVNALAGVAAAGSGAAGAFGDHRSASGCDPGALFHLAAVRGGGQIPGDCHLARLLVAGRGWGRQAERVRSRVDA